MRSYYMGSLEQGRPGRGYRWEGTRPTPGSGGAETFDFLDFKHLRHGRILPLLDRCWSPQGLILGVRPLCERYVDNSSSHVLPTDVEGLNAKVQPAAF
jgi:hypothetical protein